MKYLFIDTNLYKDVFLNEKLADRVLPLLEALTDKQYTLLLPQQVLDEIERNRYKGIWIHRKNIKKFEDATKSLRLSKDSFDEDQSIEAAIANLEEKIASVKNIENKEYLSLISKEGKPQERIDRILKMADVIDDSEIVMNRAVLRSRKGNPPYEVEVENMRDTKESKICDGYIWELLLSTLIERADCTEFLFFSKNKNDWCIDVSGQLEFHPQLANEFESKTGVKVSYKFSFDEIPDISKKVKSEVEAIETTIAKEDLQHRIEVELPERLKKSNTWDGSDLIFEEYATLIEEVSPDQVEKILKASVENISQSSGPYNQVLLASKAHGFFGKLYRVSNIHNLPIQMWLDFYTNMDSLSRKSFSPLKKALAKKDYYYLSDENRFVEVPF